MIYFFDMVTAFPKEMVQSFLHVISHPKEVYLCLLVLWVHFAVDEPKASSPGVSPGNAASSFLNFIYWFERERKGEREEERKTLLCCSTYLCIHSLFLICVLTGDRTHKLGVWGQGSKQLARAESLFSVYVLCSVYFDHYYYQGYIS